MSVVNKLINNGLTDELSFHRRRVVQLINIASLLTGFLFLILSLVYFFSGSIINGIIILSSGIVISANVIWIKYQQVTIAKIFLIYTVFFNPVITLIFVGSLPEGQYLSVYAGSLLFMNLGVLIFDRKKEPIIFYLSIVFFLFWMYFSELILFSLSEIKPSISYLQENYIYFKFPPIIGSLALSISIISFKNLIYKYEQVNEQVNAELKEVNSLLSEKNVSLEELVHERSKKLAEITTKIYTLANITSHKFRGPLATILGIANIIRTQKPDKEIQQAIPKLYDRSVEMDHVIQEMSVALEIAEVAMISKTLQNQSMVDPNHLYKNRIMANKND